MSERRQDKSRSGPKTWEEARRMAHEDLERTTDEEDAAVHAAARRDSDNRPMTERELSRFRKVSDARPDLLRKLRGQRGPQKSKPVKARVSLRLDPDILAHFKKRGPGWQSRINATLRKALKLRNVAGT